VALLHVWVNELAVSEGIRTLSIKGMAASASGLRAPRTSSDVDVLVEPPSFRAFCDALTARGWSQYRAAEHRSAPKLFEDRVGATFSHAHWPATIDAHGNFPGLLTEPQAAFDALWERRTSTSVAGIPVTTCDELGHAIILLANAARAPWSAHAKEQLAELEGNLATRLDDTRRDELATLASQTGTTDSLAEIWGRLGVRATGHSDPAALRAWRASTLMSESYESRWIEALRAVKWRERPRVLFRALWPTNDEMVAYWAAPPTATGLLSARGKRISRGLRGLPRAYRVWRRARREVRTS